MITLYRYLTLLILVNKYVPQIEDITDKNKNKDQPTTIFDWYKRLVHMVYTETRSSSGSKASHILEKFKINKDPKPTIERKEVNKTA